MIFDFATALVLSYLLIGMLANSYSLGGLSEEAVGQVDDDAIVEVAIEYSRRQYGDGNYDGLTGDAPLDIMNISHLLVVKEEDKNITRNVIKMTPRKTKTNGIGAISSRQKRNAQRKYNEGGEGGYSDEGEVWTVANEEDNITRNVSRMIPKKTKTNGTGAILSRQKRNAQRKYNDIGEGEYNYKGEVWAESSFESASNYAKGYQNPKLKK